MKATTYVINAVQTNIEYGANADRTVRAYDEAQAYLETVRNDQYEIAELSRFRDAVGL